MSRFVAIGVDELRALPDYNTAYYELLGDWRAAQGALAEAKDTELTLRNLLCAVTFIEPTEGSNVHYFGDSKKAAKLTMTHVINRKLDAAAIGTCLDTLRATIGARADEVVRFKPDLAVGEYKKLTGEQQMILAPAMTTSVGTPQLKFTDAKA